MYLKDTIIYFARLQSVLGIAIGNTENTIHWHSTKDGIYQYQQLQQSYKQYTCSEHYAFVNIRRKKKRKIEVKTEKKKKSAHFL